MTTQLAFAGTGRERGHALRADEAGLKNALSQGRVIAVWRGQLLCERTNDGAARLVWLPFDHPILTPMKEPIFLGYLGQEGADVAPHQAVFAADISAWAPEEGIPVPDGFDAGRQGHPLAPLGSELTELRQVMSQLSPDEAELAATARALTEWHRRHGFCANCGAGTAPAGAGWRRDCASCNIQHFPRTDPVVIMLVLRGNDVLLGRSPGWPEGMYSTLAGFIEPGETIEAAVRREVHEETGVICQEVRYLASQPWPFPASLMLGCVARAQTSEITIDPIELEDAIWVSREDMVAVMGGAHAVIRPPREGAIARYLLTEWLSGRLD